MPARTFRSTLPLAAVLLLPSTGLFAHVQAQAPAAPAGTAQANAAPRQSGTVKAVTPHDFVLTTAAGQDLAVTIPASVKILLVDPATRDVKTAQPGTVADIAGGDKAIVTGTPGDTGQSMTATRIYLLKSGAIAALHAQEQAAWARSVGGIVRSVDAATGAITVANGARTTTVNTSANTVVRRYAGGSVRFEDAVKSTVAAIQPGDQLQARGQRSPDGTSVTADEIVTGSFSNFSGLLTAVDPAAGTVTLKDLASKRTVTVALTGQSNLRHLPAAFAQGMAARAGAGGQAAAGARAAGSAPAGSAAAGTAPAAGAGASAGAGQAGAGARPAGAGRMDLSRMITRLPTETATDLKTGEAVMIVASNNPETGHPTAITMVSGVEAILAASPNGQATLSPWSLGSGQGEGEGAEGGGGAGGPGGR